MVQAFILERVVCNDQITGEDHRRHKTILLPGFGPNECKAFLPIFKECADSISTKWLDTIGSDNDQAVVINVLEWLSRGTLDAIGRGMITFLSSCLRCVP